MENKKLLNFLLKDLNELDELFEEKGNNSFDSLEMEFLQSRLKSSKKLVQILIERENQVQEDTSEPVVSIESLQEIETKQEENIENEIPEEEKPWEPEVEIEAVVEAVPEITIEETVEEEVELVEETVQKIQVENKIELANNGFDEVELEEENEPENTSKTLGDSFLKEKSVNDLIAGDIGKLEHKLSNRPIDSIQAAIGINDRFQYIRELFDGNAEVFVKTVSDLDTKKDLKEAVNYLQQNFKWKKTETSLKFVNLVKRRFPHD